MKQKHLLVKFGSIAIDGDTLIAVKYDVNDFFLYVFVLICVSPENFTSIAIKLLLFIMRSN